MTINSNSLASSTEIATSNALGPFDSGPLSDILGRILFFVVKDELPIPRQSLNLQLRLVSRRFNRDIGERKELLIVNHDQLVQVDKELRSKESPWRRARLCGISLHYGEQNVQAPVVMHDMLQRLSLKLKALQTLHLHGYALDQSWRFGFTPRLRTLVVRSDGHPERIPYSYKDGCEVVSQWTKLHMTLTFISPCHGLYYHLSPDSSSNKLWVQHLEPYSIDGRHGRKEMKQTLLHLCLDQPSTFHQIHLTEHRLSQQNFITMFDLLPHLTHLTTGILPFDPPEPLLSCLQTLSHLQYLSIIYPRHLLPTLLETLVQLPNLANLTVNLLSPSENDPINISLVQAYAELWLKEIEGGRFGSLYRLRIEFPVNVIEDKWEFQEFIHRFKTLGVILEIGQH